MKRSSGVLFTLLAGSLFLPGLVALAQTAVPKVPTCQITLNPSQITIIGSNVTVKWTSTNATTGAITGIGNVSPTGSKTILAPSAPQTTYFGSFSGPGGTANCKATLTVTIGGALNGGAGVDEGTTYQFGGATVQNPGTIPSQPVLNETYTQTSNSSGSSGLVQCGASSNVFEATSCQACDLAALIQRIINFMIGLSIPIAAALFAYAGVLLFTSADNVGQRAKAKEIFKKAFIGFLIAITAWLVVNTVLHVLLARGDQFTGSGWFTIQCAHQQSRPRQASLRDVLNSIPIFGGVSTNGVPTPGGEGYNASELATGNSNLLGSGGFSGAYSCPNGFVIHTFEAGGEGEYTACAQREDQSGEFNEQTAVAVTCANGTTLSGSSNIEDPSYSGECYDSRNNYINPEDKNFNESTGNATLSSNQINSGISNSERFDAELRIACTNEGLSDDECRLARAIMVVESSGNPGALSPAGAAGLMQLMPATARGLDPSLAGLSDQEVQNRLRNDPNLNIQLGVQYLGQLTEMFDSEADIIAAYNGGPRANNESTSCPGQTWWSCPLNSGYNETRKYVPNVLAVKNKII
jgi:hypothetical protein